MIALDTTAIVDLFRGVASVKEYVQKHTSFVTTRFNYLELLWGLDLEHNEAHQIELKYYEEFLQNITVFELDALGCRMASEIRWNLRKRGETVEQFDVIIAAILLRNNVHKILTRNVKDFARIEGITAVNY